MQPRKLDPLAARREAKKRMQGDPLGASMLGGYLAEMERRNPAGADLLRADIADVFNTEAGLRVLILFENAVLKSAIPNGSSDSALREANAVRNFVLEIRRIVANV